MCRQTSALRVTGLALAVAAAGRLLWWATGVGTTDLAHIARGHIDVRTLTVDRLVADLASGLALVAYAALVASIALVLVGRLLPGLATLARAVTPDGWRRVVLAACGLGICGSGLTTQAALAHDTDHAAGCSHSCAVHLTGLPLPELPTAPVPTWPAGRPSRLTVHAGDSLWRIAEQRLGRGVTDAKTAALVASLYDANEATIGPDPDLIFPGMHLTAPEGTP